MCSYQDYEPSRYLQLQSVPELTVSLTDISINLYYLNRDFRIPKQRSTVTHVLECDSLNASSARVEGAAIGVIM